MIEEILAQAGGVYPQALASLMNVYNEFNTVIRDLKNAVMDDTNKDLIKELLNRKSMMMSELHQAACDFCYVVMAMNRLGKDIQITVTEIDIEPENP